MVVRNAYFRQCGQKGQDLFSVPEVATRQLADHERVGEDLFVLQERAKACTARSEVMDPNRGVDEDHAVLLDRRRRMGRSPFSLPPSWARRRALSRAMRASRPRWIRAVFSLIPVSLAARRSMESSMLSVVLICMSMHVQCRSVKPHRGEITGCVNRRR